MLKKNNITQSPRAFIRQYLDQSRVVNEAQRRMDAANEVLSRIGKMFAEKHCPYRAGQIIVLNNDPPPGYDQFKIEEVSATVTHAGAGMYRAQFVAKGMFMPIGPGLEGHIEAAAPQEGYLQFDFSKQ